MHPSQTESHLTITCLFDAHTHENQRKQKTVVYNKAMFACCTAAYFKKKPSHDYFYSLFFKKVYLLKANKQCYRQA